MSVNAMLALLILAGTIVVFLWGRWRHDVVALASLMACVLTGLVPWEKAFAGFGHPAVITVVCVLVLSRGLQTTGAIDTFAQYVLPRNAGATWTLAGLVACAAVSASRV